MSKKYPFFDNLGKTFLDSIVKVFQKIKILDSENGDRHFFPQFGQLIYHDQVFLLTHSTRFSMCACLVWHIKSAIQ